MASGEFLDGTEGTAKLTEEQMRARDAEMDRQRASILEDFKKRPTQAGNPIVKIKDKAREVRESWMRSQVMLSLSHVSVQYPSRLWPLQFGSYGSPIFTPVPYFSCKFHAPYATFHLLILGVGVDHVKMLVRHMSNPPKPKTDCKDKEPRIEHEGVARQGGARLESTASGQGCSSSGKKSKALKTANPNNRGKSTRSKVSTGTGNDKGRGKGAQGKGAHAGMATQAGPCENQEKNMPKTPKRIPMKTPLIARAVFPSRLLHARLRSTPSCTAVNITQYVSQMTIEEIQLFFEALSVYVMRDLDIFGLHQDIQIMW